MNTSVGNISIMFLYNVQLTIHCIMIFLTDDFLNSALYTIIMCLVVSYFVVR